MLSLVMITYTHQITGSLAIEVKVVAAFALLCFNNIQDVFINPGRQLILLSLINQTAEYIRLYTLYKSLFR